MGGYGKRGGETNGQDHHRQAGKRINYIREGESVKKGQKKAKNLHSNKRRIGELLLA